MTESHLLEMYAPMTEEELFLKGLFLRRDSAERQAAWRAAHDPAFVARADEKFVLSKRVTDREALLLQESELFGLHDRSIVIRRHSRYAPAVLHMHTFFEIFFVLRGRCFQTIEGRSRYLQQGDLCFVAPYVRHAIQADDDDCIVINILVRRSNFEQVYLYMLGEENVISGFFASVNCGFGVARLTCFTTGGSSHSFLGTSFTIAVGLT